VEPESRTRLSIALALFGTIFGAILWRLSPVHDLPFGTQSILFGFVVPVLPFYVLAFAARSRRRDGDWRFIRLSLLILAALIAVMVAVPNVWWYFTYGAAHYRGGGVHRLLAVLFALVPAAVPFVLFLGLMLSRERS
jgi:hypothetical protein